VYCNVIKSVKQKTLSFFLKAAVLPVVRMCSCVLSLPVCSVCFAEAVREAALLRELRHPQQSGAQQVEGGSERSHAATSLQTGSPSQRLMICGVHLLPACEHSTTDVCAIVLNGRGY